MQLHYKTDPCDIYTPARLIVCEICIDKQFFSDDLFYVPRWQSFPWALSQPKTLHALQWQNMTSHRQKKPTVRENTRTLRACTCRRFSSDRMTSCFPPLLCIRCCMKERLPMPQGVR